MSTGRDDMLFSIRMTFNIGTGRYAHESAISYRRNRCGDGSVKRRTVDIVLNKDQHWTPMVGSNVTTEQKNAASIPAKFLSESQASHTFAISFAS